MAGSLDATLRDRRTPAPQGESPSRYLPDGT
jgi:hypothetical protein